MTVIQSTLFGLRPPMSGKALPFRLSVAGHVVVKARLLYINIYKESTADKDAEMLRDFSRKWADVILAANR